MITKPSLLVDICLVGGLCRLSPGVQDEFEYRLTEQDVAAEVTHGPLGGAHILGALLGYYRGWRSVDWSLLKKRKRPLVNHACTQRKPELCCKARENAQTFSTIGVDSILIWKSTEVSVRSVSAPGYVY